MSRIFKKGTGAQPDGDPLLVREIGAPSASLWNDSDHLFESTGFLAGMKACERKISAQEVIAGAKKKADEIAKEAYRKGFEQGERDGFEVGNKKAVSVAEEFQTVLDEIRTAREEILLQSEREAAALAMTLAEKIICREIEIQKECIMDVAKEALTMISGGDNVQIVLNPDDYAFLEGCKSDLLESVQGIKSISLEKESAVGRGGCIVKTSLGELDARVNNKIDHIFNALKDKVHERTGE